MASVMMMKIPLGSKLVDLGLQIFDMNVEETLVIGPQACFTFPVDDYMYMHRKTENQMNISNWFGMQHLPR